MRMYIRSGLLGAIAFSCLLTFSFSEAAYSQTSERRIAERQARIKAALNDPGYTHFNCEGAEAECLISETPAPGVRMVRPKDYPIRPAHYLSSNLYTTLAAGRETGNRFVSFDFLVPPEGGPLPHTHRNEWETFFVSDGIMKFAELDPTPPFNYIFLDEPAGTVVYGSLGPVHGFQNKTPTTGRIFSFAMPAGLDQFFHNAGEEVADYNAPIPPISTAEIVRTAFWAEQRGDSLWFLGAPPPVIPAGNPQPVISSKDDPKRPTETGPFGEKRVVLLTQTEVGNVTGATAFCGPGLPGRPGGSVKYTYLTANKSDFATMYTSKNTEVFYTLGGALSFRFGGFVGNTVTVEPGTFVQIETGVPFSIANLASAPAQSLAISVISPDCPAGPPPGAPTTTAVAGPKNATTTQNQFQLDATKSTSFDGKPLKYQWTLATGSPSAAITAATTATPLVQFNSGTAAYSFVLTVTDSSGKTASDTVSVNYVGR